MENESEVIQQQMLETRTALSEKLETLEAKVVGTVENATTAVAETVESVKETVQETVENVKETMYDAARAVKDAFDFEHHVQQHPWLMVGGAVAVGCLGGYALGGGSAKSTAAASSPSQWALRESGNGQAAAATAPAPLKEMSSPFPAEPPAPSWLGQLGDTFHAELSKLKGLAIGTSLGLLRDMIGRSTPDSLSQQLTEVVDSITTKLGGEPIRGPVMAKEETPKPAQTEVVI